MKTPKPKKLPSGRWHIQLRLGGKSTSITEPTQRAVIQKAQMIKAEHLAGKREKKAAGIDTLDAIVTNYINAKRPVLSPSTVQGYLSMQKTRFQAYMQAKASAINYQEMVNDESKLCAPKTLKSAWALVAASLGYADMPVPNVSLPQLVQKEHPWLDPEQIKTFLAAIHGEPVELAALLALHGLRRSELLALDYSDIDLKAGTIRVAGAVVLGENSKYVEKQTNKNRSSRRTVPIMIPRLKELLLAVPKEQRKGKVVTCSPNTTWDRVNTICERNGLPRVGVHGLRHSFASLAYHLGLSERETMLLGGWSDPSTMRKIYTHISNKDMLAAQNKITQFFSPKEAAKKTQNANENANVSISP